MEERVITKNGNFWAEDEGGNGHWALKEDTEVAGVEGVDIPSLSSSEPCVEEMVSVRSNVDKPDIRLVIYADPEFSELEMDVLLSILGGAESEEVLDDIVVVLTGP